MLLIEADGKALFAQHGIAVPAGIVVTDGVPALPGAGPWMVKAQVPVGGRGKAGGIVRAGSPDAVAAACSAMLGQRLKGHQVDVCLVEQIAAGQERYLSVMVDAASYGLRVLYSAQGGVEIEQAGLVQERLCDPSVAAVSAALAELLTDEPVAWRDAVARIGVALTTMVLERELALAEINPLFVSAACCVAGDAKVVVDLNAIDRQPLIASMI